ncbi:MAG: hypothetical protein AAF726_23300 [Planctomycetota bacterium]
MLHLSVALVASSFLPASEPSCVLSPAQSDDPNARAHGILQLAFDSASRLPEMPHVKTRSRLQGELVEAALDAGSVSLANDWASRITNWRQALAYATVASYCAEHGEEELARKALGSAERLETGLTGDSVRGWRRDRVRVRIAETYLRLGDREAAAALQVMVDPEEGGHLSVVDSQLREMDAEAIDAQVERLVKIAEEGSFAVTLAALKSMGHLYGRAYEDDDRRAAIETKIRAGWTTLPSPLRMEVLEILIEYDLEHDQKARALTKIGDVEAFAEGRGFQPELLVAFGAKVARLRGEAGDREGGIRAADDALTLYDETRESIVEIFRGEALRPLAEAYVELGETMTATDLYKRALAEAVVNPNSRPRAEDLVKTTISIVRSGIEPSDALIEALEETAESLGDPW